MLIRINKYLSQAGINSRRKCDDLIKKGLVAINGKKAVNGDKVNIDTDKITVSGRVINLDNQFVYFILNKPLNYICTVRDEMNRKTVLDLLLPEDKKRRVYPVGRLDYDSTGLILLTNDGELTHKITHPKHHWLKTYEVQIKGDVKQSQIDKLKSGVDIDGYITKPAKIEIINKTKNNTLLKFQIGEGKYRQIRRMCQSVGLEISSLHRTNIGPLSLEDLKIGEYKKISKSKLHNLID